MGVYDRLLRYKLTERQLQDFTFPRPHPSYRGEAQLFNLTESHYLVMPSALRRNCKRCKKIYDVDSDGLAIRPEECFYHPYRLGGGRYAKHRCCQKGEDSAPCKTAPRHITEDIDPNHLPGFITTKNNRASVPNAIYAIDCEMVCTRAGLELAALSVVDSNRNAVYETMVLPDNPVMDYLTEHSGLTSSDFRGVTTRLADVHQKILSLFGGDTILVGHGLNHDLLAMKLIHDTVVDTVVAYPHPRGRRFRNSLGKLMEMYLGSSQSSNPIGLKCRQDAIAAMKLALLKAK